MKANSSKTASQDRPAPMRRRASRSFAPASFALECRQLLATSGLTASVSVSAPAVIGSVSTTPTVSFSAASSIAPPRPGGPGASATPGEDLDAGPGPGFPPPGGQSPPHDHRVGMAEANVLVGGKLTPEFAFADSAESKVVVKVGFGPLITLSAAQGISSPASVLLKDVNGDGLPDLLVANTGGDNVLVFPGLAGGGVGPEMEGGRGFAVGQEPAGITVCALDAQGGQDLIVANRGSNNVTILDGQGRGANWTLAPAQTLGAGAAPVRTGVADLNGDGKPDLFILNSGSDDVTMYRGLGGGRFEAEASARFAVGLAPIEMFIGRFDRRPGLDLITVNTGSDSVSFIAGINTASPESMTFTSGGTQPDAAFAVDLNHDGVLDLVVANGGDGRVALFRGGNVGLQLAQVITRPDLPAPTALAPDYATGARLDFYAAGAGQDAAQLLQFDLGQASAFLLVPPDSSGSSDAESELIAQLLPFGDSELALIAVLWEGEPGSRSRSWESEGRGASLSPVPYAKADGEPVENDVASAPANPSPIAVPPEDPASWVRYVIGSDLALGEPRDLLLAFAPMDEEPGDPRPPALPLPERPAIDPDLEAAAEAIDEALRSLRSEAPAPGVAAPVADPERVGLGAVDAPPREGYARSVPAVASSILIASRLILKAATPRPPSIRRGVGRRIDPTVPGRDRPTRL